MKRPISARSSSAAGGVQRIGGATRPSWQAVLRTVTATRYVTTPLREGGSLPAIVEADDDGLYVCKFRGAGQGPKALAAEIVAGELAADSACRCPSWCSSSSTRRSPRPSRIPRSRTLIVASAGLNLGVDFLPGALPYTPTAPPDGELGADVVWLDALVTNVDRTPRNPNLLRWHKNLWLIDHGAALYAFHGGDPLARARVGFPAIRDHVLLPAAGSIEQADARLAERADPGAAAALVPEAWADGLPYAEYLEQRLRAPREFAEEAERARAA